MSFLNPVSEPVLRFKSTDAGAPQINYNVRVAGDVKAVLKACLVTGYGAIASAGWTAANEVAHVIEFVSPGAAMSDYRIGVDDTSVGSTAWYYQYQDVRTNPAYNEPTKGFSYVDKTHASNGWQLLVTDRGILLLEFVQHTTVSKLSTRITYIGQVKSALASQNGKNIAYFNVGHNSPIGYASRFFNQSGGYVHGHIEAQTNVIVSSATSVALSQDDYPTGNAEVDLAGEIYLVGSSPKSLVAKLPPILSKIVNNLSDMFGVYDVIIDGRQAVSVCAGDPDTTANTVGRYSRTFLIYLDYWEY